MSDTFLSTSTTMGTVLRIQVVGHGATDVQRQARSDAVERAMMWFQQINDTCTRFDPLSELSQLSAHIGQPVAVSSQLFVAVQFALVVAEESGGAFDPTVGHRMEQRGFNREYRSGALVSTSVQADEVVSWRDVQLDAAAQTITLLRPLLLDLGAVAKGLAIDLAALELKPFTNFAIDAGGDLYLGGHNSAGEKWSVGIRHPRDTAQVLTSIRASDTAVCTSGDYERYQADAPEAHHILNPKTGTPAQQLASATVVAPTAIMADALATAAFVLGPSAGLELLERHGVDALLVTTELEQYMTVGMSIA